MGRGAIASCAVISTAVTCLILGFLVYFSWPLFKEGRWYLLCSWNWIPSKGQWGVYPMILGSVGAASIATLIAVPLAVGFSSFIVVIGPKSLRRWFRGILTLMTGMPTVVLALISVTTLVPLIRRGAHGSGFSWLATSVTLGVLVLPTATRALLSTLEEKWSAYKMPAAALGLSPAQTLMSIVLPQSKRALGVSIILAWARALGDTMIALMISGNAPHLPRDLFDTLRTLPAHIALVVQGDGEHSSYHAVFFCGLLLFLMTALARGILKRIGVD